MPDRMSREAVAVFRDERSLQRAVDDLLISGFDRSAVSLLAGQQVVEASLRHAYRSVADLEDDPSVPRVHYAGTDSRTEATGAVIGGFAYVGACASAGVVAASGGTALAALLAVAATGGVAGLLGVGVARLIARHHAQHLQTQLDKGGLVLWVRVANDDQERDALEILMQHEAGDIHIHQLPVIDFAAMPRGGVSRDMSFMKLIGL